ncbi:MAG: hypothetical protein KJ808_00400 [Acidobacteria bacterium]|nr:hypothetical protein [Acidobacteriota bacterium]MBU4307224.1 hypothetical protein [Acidobacteriota bacterium]MCG2810099.1 hypothetical protein [Candidatus Aminicenantes bacterium]
MKKIGIIILVSGVLCFVIGIFNSDFYWLLKIISFLLLGMGILLLIISAVSKSEEKKRLQKDLNIPLDSIDDDLNQYEWSWIHMGDDKVCPDCERLAALPAASMTEWVTERTEPGRGDTACGKKCRCAMVPANLVSVTPGNRDEQQKLAHELDDLIGKYKAATNYAKLPKEYYAIDNFEGQIKFLTNFLELNK